MTPAHNNNTLNFLFFWNTKFVSAESWKH